MKTLPLWAVDWGIPLDPLRAFLRRRSDLAALAVKHGAVRIFDAESAEKIRTEFLALKQGNGTKA